MPGVCYRYERGPCGTMPRKCGAMPTKTGSPDWPILSKKGFPHAGCVAMRSKRSDMILENTKQIWTVHTCEYYAKVAYHPNRKVPYGKTP